MKKDESVVIALTTDFGVKDGYVGIVKGTILTIAPRAHIVDISHEITSYDTRQAAWIIYTSYKFFPKRTIFLTVVDPGVGSSRRPVLLTSDDYMFLGPDNGVFTYLLAEQTFWQAFELNNARSWQNQVSTTFHARDIFAPVSAHLANGIEIAELATKIDTSSLARFDTEKPRKLGKTIEGKIIYIDHFGNLISNINRELIAGNSVCYLGTNCLGPIVPTYSAGEENKAVSLIGSHGHLEIAVLKGNAAELLKAGIGSSVVLENNLLEEKQKTTE